MPCVMLAVVLIFCFPRCMLFIKRFLFKKKIEKTCAKLGAQVIWYRNPLCKISKFQKGFDFTVQTAQKTYHVVLLSARYRHREYSFVSPTEMVIHRKIFFIIVGKKRRFSEMLPQTLVGTSKVRSIKLCEEVPKGEEKILLFYPVSAEVTWLSPGKGKRALGNGDLFWNGYRFFTRSGFFAEISSPGKYLRKIEPWEDE
ncbi:MAG: hypothetical protein IKU24_01310 [Clostridia bacterium]|nr:hypothetical protein [Clostridia bacterium]